MSDPLLQHNHVRRLLTTFRHVDELVSQAVARLGPVSSESPLSEFVLDAALEQHTAAVEYLDQLRNLMGRFLQSHQIPVPKRNVSALWAAHTACVHAKLSVEELRADSMRSCGKLSPDAEQELEALASGLSDIIQKMSEHLAPPTSEPRA
jgi:hypothetical protein